MSPRTTLTAEQLLADFPPTIQKISGRLRDSIKLHHPSLQEKVYPGWRALGFSHPTAGYICGIFPYVESVKLIFEWGIRLPDPDGVLQGNGQQVRYLEYRSVAEIKIRTVERFLDAAISLPPSLKRSR